MGTKLIYSVYFFFYFFFLLLRQLPTEIFRIQPKAKRRQRNQPSFYFACAIVIIRHGEREREVCKIKNSTNVSPHQNLKRFILSSRWIAYGCIFIWVFWQSECKWVRKSSEVSKMKWETEADFFSFFSIWMGLQLIHKIPYHTNLISPSTFPSPSTKKVWYMKWWDMTSYSFFLLHYHHHYHWYKDFGMQKNLQAFHTLYLHYF